MVKQDPRVFHIGMKGSVIAIDLATGQTLWRSTLKGYGFVNVTWQADLLVAATGGELFCLDPATGNILWNNRLSGMGFGLATFANADNATAIAEVIRQAEAAATAAPATP
jgi:outer membrane protein assembly factor BamB